MSESIVIANSTIRQQDGLYCLYRLNGRLAAAQPYTKNGWFEHKYGDSVGKAFMQVLVTPLGMMKLAQKLEIAV